MGDTSGWINVVFNRAKNIPEGDPVGVLAQSVPTGSAANALDEVRSAQSHHDLVQVFSRDALAPGNIAATDDAPGRHIMGLPRLRTGVVGQIHHDFERVAAFRRDIQMPVPLKTRCFKRPVTRKVY